MTFLKTRLNKNAAASPSLNKTTTSFRLLVVILANVWVPAPVSREYASVNAKAMANVFLTAPQHTVAVCRAATDLVDCRKLR